MCQSDLFIRFHKFCYAIEFDLGKLYYVKNEKIYLIGDCFTLMFVIISKPSHTLLLLEQN